MSHNSGLGQPQDFGRSHSDVVEIKKLREQLARAVELLQEFGTCDQYTGEPYDEVHEFLRSLGIEPRA